MVSPECSRIKRLPGVSEASVTGFYVVLGGTVVIALVVCITAVVRTALARPTPRPRSFLHDDPPLHSR
jgi:hypothetical protein